MVGVSRASLLALLEAGCSSPTASHRIPSLAVVFHAVVNSVGVEGRPADPSLLPVLVAAAHESEPQLQALEDHQPCDVRAGAVVRWNGELHRLLPGFLDRPISAIDELALLADAIDPVLVDHQGYGLGDLIELALRRMNNIAGVLSAAWPDDEMPEPGVPARITNDEFEAACRLEDVFVQVDACEAPDRAREALLAHSVSPGELACGLDDPVSVFADTVCVRLGAEEWAPVPGGLLLEALVACGVRLAELASRLSGDAETRWRSLVSDHVGHVLAGSAHPITGPVAVSPTTKIHSMTQYSPTQLLVIDVAAALTQDGLDRALDASDAGLDTVVPGAAVTADGLDRVGDDADIVVLQVAAAPGVAGLAPASKYPRGTLTDLKNIARSTSSRPPDLWFFLRDYSQLRSSSAIWSLNLAPLWMIWAGRGRSFPTGAVAPGLVSVDPRIMRSEWADAADASVLERALLRLGFPGLFDLPIVWHYPEESVVGDAAESRMYRILAWEIPVAVSMCDRRGPFRETDPLWALSKILSAKLKDTKRSFLAMGHAAGLTHLIFEIGYTSDTDDALVLELFDDSVIRLSCSEFLLPALLQDSVEVESAIGHAVADALPQSDATARFKQDWDAAPPAIRVDGMRYAQDAVELAPPIEPHDSQSNDVQRRLSLHLAGRVEPGSYGRREAVRIESEVIYPWLLEELHALLGRYRHEEMLEYALSQLERANHHRLVNQHRIAWRRGTFDSDAHEERSEEDRLTILTKCVTLIAEETLAQTPQGDSSPDRLGWIQLLSVAQLCVESSLRSESIHLHLADPTMTISDRYRVDLDARFPEVDIHAYQEARKAMMLPEAVPMGSSEAHLPEPEDIQPLPLIDQVPDLADVDRELKATLGFSLDALRGVLSMACEWEVSASTYIAQVSAEAFLDKLAPSFPLASRDEHARALEWLTLNRAGLLADAHNGIIEHWELERRAARVITRPFIKGANGIYILPWTSQFSMRILRNYLVEGRLPWPDHVLPTKVCKALNRYRQGVAKAFEHECVRVLSDSRLIIRRNIEPSKAHQYGIDELYGEIDVLCVDPQTSRIWVIEAKDLAMPFSSRSLRRHINKFIHEGAFIDKLIHKVNDVRTSAANIAARLGADSPTRSWTVIGLMVTVTPEPAAYVQGVEVPFCTIDQLADVVLSDTVPKSGAVPR